MELKAKLIIYTGIIIFINTYVLTTAKLKKYKLKKYKKSI